MFVRDVRFRNRREGGRPPPRPSDRADRRTGLTPAGLVHSLLVTTQVVARVHGLVPKQAWKGRYRQINEFEWMPAFGSIR